MTRLLVPLVVAFAIFPLTDTDIWWHLACAREWVTTWTPVREQVVTVHEYSESSGAPIVNKVSPNLAFAVEPISATEIILSLAIFNFFVLSFCYLFAPFITAYEIILYSKLEK